MRKPSSAAIPLFILFAAGVASAAERSGEDIYTATCASCHGSDGRGAPASQTGLSLAPLDFTDCQKTNREPDQDWHAVIARGGPARGFHRLMPAFGEVLSEGEQEVIVEYVRGFCADPVWPRGDLNLPRPLVTEKAFVEDEVVLSTAVATRSPRNVDSQLVYEQRFLRRQMFEVRLPFSVAQVPGGDREGGIGDIGLALKSMLVGSLQAGTALSIGAEAVLPTGNKDKGFGKGVVVFEPFLAFGQLLPWDSFLQAQVGAEIPAQEGDGVENEGFVRGVLGTTFTHDTFGRTFTPMVEAIGFREIASGATTALDLVPEIQISVSKRRHILACLGARIPTLNREGRGPAAMAYLLWDWFDGGLLEGW
jgi:mono/diheme cytochrome c family protein